MVRGTGIGTRLGPLVVGLAVLALVVVGLVSAPTAGGSSAPTAGASGPSPATPISSVDSPALLYFNGTVNGNGGTQTVYTPSPPNGTVWDLVSAKITITASTAVSAVQNSYLYDSVCTQLNVAPAPSACKGIFGPNVNGWANDVMEPGKSGTVVGEGGYSASAPEGVSYYSEFKQTIHLTYDIFLSFGADLSSGVSSSYYIVVDPEVGNYPSFAFYRYSDPVTPLSSAPTTVSFPGPPTGYVYRMEIAWTTIDFGSALGPYRLAEIFEEPSGYVLAKINNWTSGYSGASACGGYSSAQTCISDNGVGTETVWDDPILLSSSDSFKAEFVGVSGDSGDFAVVVTEYPATSVSAEVPAAPTGLTVGSVTASSIHVAWTQPGGGGIVNDTVYSTSTPGCTGRLTAQSTGGPAVTATIGSLPSATTEYLDVTAWNATGQSPPSSCVAATTSSAPTSTNETSELEMTVTSPNGTPVPGIVVLVNFRSPSEFPSVAVGPTNDSGGAVVGNVSSGATIANLSVEGTAYALRSYSVANPEAGLVLLQVVVAAPAPGESYPTGSPIQFTEQGLGSGTVWWVSVTGPESESFASSGSIIGFELENGTYQYSLGTSADFNASTPDGTFVLPESASPIAVNFTSALPSPSPPPPTAAVASPPASISLEETLGLMATGVAAGGMLVYAIFGYRRPPGATSARRVRVADSGRATASVSGSRSATRRYSTGELLYGTPPRGGYRLR